MATPTSPVVDTVEARIASEAANNAVAWGVTTGSNPLDANPFNVHPGGCYFVGGKFVDANGVPIEFEKPSTTPEPVVPLES